MTTLDNWAIERLSGFLNLDRETIKTQVAPYLLTFQDKADLAEYLKELLGVSGDSTTFIQEFIAKEFPRNINQAHSKNQSRRHDRTNPNPSQGNNKKERSQAPSSVSKDLQNQKEEKWKNDKNVYMKKDQEESYIVGSKKPKQQKTTSNRPYSPSAPLSFRSVASKEGKPPTDYGKRIPCDCQATRHPLLKVVPNCLTCGKIICESEGVGPCTFCGELLTSREQQLEVIKQAKRQNKSEQSKISGETVSNEPEKSEDDEKVLMFIKEEERQAAEKLKETLLEYDQTSAKRSKVIDRASDFVLPGDRRDQWLTKREQQILQKKQQDNLRKVEERAYQKRKVMTIDTVNNRVTVEVKEEAEEEDKDPAEILDEHSSLDDQTKLKRQVSDDTGGRRNNIIVPMFIAVNQREDKERKDSLDKQRDPEKITNYRPPPRVQHDMVAYLEETISFSGHSGQINEDVTEPDCG